MSSAFVKEEQQSGGVLKNYSAYGYAFRNVETKQIIHYCSLTIGSIILFNDKKCIVIHTEIPSGNRDYVRKIIPYKVTIDVTKSTHGMLKDILSGKEFRANWSTLTADKIIYYEEN